MNRFHPLTVASVQPDARDCVVVTFDVPPPLAATFAYRAGQHLTLRADIDGQDLRRSYSVCAAPGDGVLRVAIKRCPGGAFSNWANDRLRAGDVLQVLPPAGHFGDLPGDLPGPQGLQGQPGQSGQPGQLGQLGQPGVAAPAAARRYLALAAGSGITPIYSIVRTRLQAEPDCQVTLVCGNRASSSVVLREALAALKDEHPRRLALVHVLTREPQDIELFNGRLTRAKLDELFARWVRVPDHDAAFVCGPDAVMRDARDALVAAGMPEAMVRIERFAASIPPRAPHVPHTVPVGAHADCEVTLVIDGRRQSFSMPQDRDTVLDAGLAHGIDIRHACKGGVCATCRCKLLEGRVEMDAHHALEDYEIARGFVLACQAYPVTPRVVLDFDQDH